MQVPPTFSAVKVAGERAYDMAREGRPPNLEPRPARVDRFELIERPDADTAIFEVASGKGVYMRSLARDLAQACGTLGHIAALRRLRVGPFTEAQATPLDKLRATDDTPPASPDLLLPVATALADIPALALTEAEVSGLRHGQAISLVTLMGRIPGSADPAGGLVRAMAGGRVIGLARLEDGWMKPARMLYGLLPKETITMSITAERRTALIGEYATAPEDTGSPEVQVALLSERIGNLTEHLKTHAKDFHSRRGLLMLVGRRRRLLDYLKAKNQGRYETLIGRLSLRR